MNTSDINTLTGFLGTYASDQSEGIYRFTMDPDTGALTAPELYYKALDCKYLSLFDSLIAAPIQRDGHAGICVLDTCGREASFQAERFEEDKTACFVAQDEDYIYSANYHQGLVLIYRKKGDSLTLHKRIEIAPGAGCHQILFHRHFMLVPCLLLDEIRIFDCSRDYCPAGAIRFQPGTGPRHGVFTKDHRFFFVVTELSNELYMYHMENESSEGSSGFMEPRLSVRCPLLPKDQAYTAPPASAAIRLSPDGRYLYLSTRFADVITVFAVSEDGLAFVQQTGSGGVHPRDFVITGDGRFLLAVNRTKGGLVCFPLHADSGKLGPECSRVPAPEAVSIVLAG